MAYTLNRRLAELVASNGQLNAGKIPDNEITQAKLHSSFTVTASHLGTSLTPTFGNTTVGSRLTFSSNSHYLETGTNAVAIKSSGGNVYLNATNSGITINNGLTVNSNITTTGYLAGPSTFTIDPAAVGDNTGTVVIAGNLQVDGSTTTINSTTLDVDDLNITVAKGAANATAANGAGITVDGANATLTYTSAQDEWNFNKNLVVGGKETTASFPLMVKSNTAHQGLHIEENSGAESWQMGVDVDGDLNFYNSGSTTPSITFDDSGQVGIGTPSPSFQLHVLNTIGTRTLSLGHGVSSGTITTDQAKALNFQQAGTTKMTLDSSGKLGIGATSPSKKLSIHDNAAHQLQLHGGNSYWNIGTGWSGYYQDYLLFATSTGEKMVIDTNGNVGIGLNGPSAKLHIVNNSTSLDALLLQSTEDSSSAAPILAFKRNSGSVADADYLGQLKFKGENDADQEVVYAKITSKIQDASDGSEDGLIEFANRKAGSNVITARLRSDSLQLLNSTNLTVDGNIGVGQTNPSFKLDVTGTFRTTGDAYFQNDIYVDDKIRHNGDVDNYIHFSGADTQTFVTNNLTRLTIASDGHISAASTLSAASKLSVGTTSAHASYDFYNNGTSYLNGAVTVDDALNITGSNASLTVAGNVGIGTNNPSHQLDVYNSSGWGTIHIDGTSGGELALQKAGTRYGGLYASNSHGLVVEAAGGTNTMLFLTNSTERMRIDSSGNLLVGKTTGASATAGHRFNPNGSQESTASGTQPLYLNRLSSDGNIIVFDKDNSTVGSIGTEGTDLTIGSGGAALQFLESENRIRPWNMSTNGGSDNVVDLGRSNQRFNDLYLGGGVFLGGTGSPNYLDDYEEGSWTPALVGVTTNSISENGIYTKIGNLVHIHAKITATVASLPGATFTISGLPFSATNSSDTGQRAIITIGGDSLNLGGLANGRAHFRTNNSQLQGVYMNSGSTAYWTYNTMDSSTFELHLSGTYRT